MSRERILVVDDEMPMRRYLLRLLAPLGHEVLQAGDGVQALEMIGRAPVDLVISDLKMPRMEGLTLLEKLRTEAHSDAAFILLTAYSDLETALAARDRFNIANFLVKPIHNQDQFLFDVQSALYRRHLELENNRLLAALAEANEDLERRVEARTRELRETNEELARLSGFRADVLKVLSHELRTPVALLGGYLGLQQQRSGEDAGFLPPMEAALERVQDIVDKAIQQMKGPQTARFDLELSRVEPARLAETVVQRLNPLLEPRGIAVELDAGPAGPCRWDRRRVEGIIEELLINAVRASPDGAGIHLEVRPNGERVVYRVRDRGEGISAADRERIFEPFVTLGPPERHTSGQFAHRAQGVGLGLSIARIWSRLHGGSVEARPNPEGPGTTVELALPYDAAALAADSQYRAE